MKLSIGDSVHDPKDPVGRLLFNVLAMVAEFESDLVRSRTREGMAIAKAKGHLRGKPKSSLIRDWLSGASPGGCNATYLRSSRSAWEYEGPPGHTPSPARRAPTRRPEKVRINRCKFMRSSE